MTVLAVLTTVLRLLLDPYLAHAAGAHMAGRPDLSDEIYRICRRESWGCRRIGVHLGHVERMRPEVFISAARRSGVLDGGCWTHQVAAVEWGPRGPHGHVPGHALRHLPRFSPPAVLDIPLVSVYVAAKRLEELASRYKRRTPEARAHAWRHGVRCRCAEFERAAGAG